MMKTVSKLFAVAVSVLASSMVFAEPSELKVQEEAFGDWKVACREAKSGETKKSVKLCRAYTTASQKKTGKMLFRMVLSYPNGSAIPRAVITTPLGVALMPGVELEVSGVKYNYRYLNCGARGCNVAFKVDETMLKALKQGTKASIKFALLGREKPQGVVVPLSLKGFTKSAFSLYDKRPKS
ncbi:invasion associated locus B family protein [Candidatus Reidiella endopervernicosa]|uniref:Invasion associated locus B family protein n=1 Tax=Candidatus Reidiella endopervernicosa TaxID=2738883 RepID=A0A6N0HR91_9GAMM|nr:invasion associated locus B family protein [Candidatus Reidiella endopervernicosa]